MLLRYGAKNFYCFKEGVEISFELSSNCPNNISKGKLVSNLICVKGANGSGKTNALKILSFLKEFCADSFGNKPKEDILISSFFFNTKAIDIFCEFEVKGTEYIYDLSLTKKKIISERLQRKKKRVTTVFERKGNKLLHVTKEFSELKKINLRSNASIISTANQYEIRCIYTTYMFFNRILSNVYWGGRQDFPKDYYHIAKYYNEHPDVLNFSIGIIKTCDLGINDMKIRTRKDESGKNIYFPIFEHDTDAKNNTLTFLDQSSGTKELFTTLPYYKVILEAGGVLVLDEFDINLHPHILPMLIKLFDDKKTNPRNAQLIFTTQNDHVIDYMSKYRLVIVNKENSESYAYRLDEIPGDILRNNRSICPIYNSGKIGGIPKI